MINRKGAIMKNKKIVLVFVIFSFLATNCYSKNKVSNLIQNKYEYFRLINYKKGNFTNSGQTEILAYYNAKDFTKKDIYQYNVANKLVIFVIKQNKIINEYELKYWNGASYDSDKDGAVLNNKEIINNKKLKFGKWDGYTFVYDYNGNGLDEILLLSNSPETFLPYIFEFHDGKMKTVLDVKDEDNFDANVKGFVETTSDKKGKYVEIYDAFESSRTESVWWEKYTWSKNKKMYVLVDSKLKKYVP